MCPFCISVGVASITTVGSFSFLAIRKVKKSKLPKANFENNGQERDISNFNSMNNSDQNAMPLVVSQTQWEDELKDLLIEEKALGRKQDALNARRRRLPMVKVSKDYYFMDENKKISLRDLFQDRKQLIVYSAMLEPGAKPCVGCSMVMDNIGHNVTHINARDTSFVFTSPAPQNEIKELQHKMQWFAPWYTDINRNFSDDFGTGKGYALNVFIQDEKQNIYRTYFTTGRGGEVFDINLRLLDLTPYGRQETWEDSPKGWPQTSEACNWWRLHNDYSK